MNPLTTAAAVGLVVAGSANGTVSRDDDATGAPFLRIDRTVAVPGWKIRGRTRVIAVMVGPTTELDPAGNTVEGVPAGMDGAVTVVCAGRRGGVAHRTVRFRAEGDGQNASIIRLPGCTTAGARCASWWRPPDTTTATCSSTR